MRRVKLERLFVAIIIVIMVLSLTACGGGPSIGELHEGDQITFGKCNGEDISWTCIKNDAGEKTLISDNVLFYSAVNTIGTYCWHDSSLRDYLNDTFYNACFTDDEKAHIKKTKVESIRDWDESLDFVYIPSETDIKDIEQYSSVCVKATDFAKNQLEQSGESDEDFLWNEAASGYCLRDGGDAFYEDKISGTAMVDTSGSVRGGLGSMEALLRRQEDANGVRVMITVIE